MYTRSRPTHARLPATLLGALCVALSVTLAGCGAAAKPAAPSKARQRAALAGYLHAVEPVRLAVNRLLEGADPILSAYHDHHISAKLAAQRMEALERRFAVYTVQMAAIEPADRTLRAINAPYAHTYILEDAYLSALASGLSDADLDGLPETQAAQRASIIQWRTELTVLAERLHVRLPADLQVAGRGEIAPSPDGS
jgi:hypothetical protein